MTVNASGKINRGGVAAIKDIAPIRLGIRTPKQAAYFAGLLKELKVQPKRWEAYQDWGSRGPRGFLKKYGIGFGYRVVETWRDSTTTNTVTLGCPHCASDRVIKVGKRSGYQRYQCNVCRKKFHANGNAPGKQVHCESDRRGRFGCFTPACPISR